MRVLCTLTGGQIHVFFIVKSLLNELRLMGNAHVIFTQTPMPPLGSSSFSSVEIKTYRLEERYARRTMVPEGEFYFQRSLTSPTYRKGRVCRAGALPPSKRRRFNSLRLRHGDAYAPHTRARIQRASDRLEWFKRSCMISMMYKAQNDVRD